VKLIVKARRTITIEQTTKFDLDVPDYLTKGDMIRAEVVEAYLANHADDLVWKTSPGNTGRATGTAYTYDPDEPLPEPKTDA
jgi:hypothetical protein